MFFALLCLALLFISGVVGCIPFIGWFVKRAGREGARASARALQGTSEIDTWLAARLDDYESGGTAINAAVTLANRLDDYYKNSESKTPRRSALRIARAWIAATWRHCIGLLFRASKSGSETTARVVVFTIFVLFSLSAAWAWQFARMHTITPPQDQADFRDRVPGVIGVQFDALTCFLADEVESDETVGNLSVPAPQVEANAKNSDDEPERLALREVIVQAACSTLVFVPLSLPDQKL